MFTRRKCDGGLNSQADERRICPLCNDRYQYLQCIYDNYLTDAGDKRQQILQLVPEGSSTNWNTKAYKSSIEGKWGDKEKNYLQASDYGMTNFLANQNAMTLVFHVPGSNLPLEKCIPCNRNITLHAGCMVQKGKNFPNWIWNPNIQYAQA